jgi:hypothetical protein
VACQGSATTPRHSDLQCKLRAPQAAIAAKLLLEKIAVLLSLYSGVFDRQLKVDGWRCLTPFDPPHRCQDGPAMTMPFGSALIPQKRRGHTGEFLSHGAWGYSVRAGYGLQHFGHILPFPPGAIAPDRFEQPVQA